MFAIRHKVLVLFVTLLITIAFTTTAYTFDPPEPQSPPVSQENLSQDAIPMLSESDSMLIQSDSETLQPYHRASDEPMAAISDTLSYNRSASVSRLNREHKRIDTSAFKEIELETEYLREPLDLQTEYRKTHNLSQDRQSTRNRSHSVATTCTVTTPADSGPGTLRQCLLDATPNDTINFDSQLFLPTDPVTITLLSALSWITTDRLTIDGSNAGVILNGNQLSEGSGLVIDGADGVVIQGLYILNFPQDGIALINGARNTLIGGDSSDARNLISGNSRVGVVLKDPSTTNNTVQGNYIGTDATGTAAQGNSYGVIIDNAQNNMIGGHTEGARNVISGNAISGVHIQNVGSTGNQVQGNYIGTDTTGTARLGNENGVIISSGAQVNTIGGDTAAARNVISGNTLFGIWLSREGTSGNQVQGNYIGTDLTGTALLGNSYGVFIGLGAQNNVIGGESTGTRNLISGNTNGGVWLQGEGVSGNKVQGNYIGTDRTGAASLGNNDGVFIGFGAQNNLIGGETTAARNLISGNTDTGIQLQEPGTSGNKVQGNYIGTDLTGTIALSNTIGVMILLSAENNLIGGEVAGMRNLISGNTDIGIIIQDSGTSGNQILGNYIGTDQTGMAPLANNDGVLIGFGAQRNVVGGETTAARNLISGNTNTGIKIQNEGTISNIVQGNYIGTDVTGTVRLGNNWGVIILQRAQNNLVGGNIPGTHNLISGNTEAGIQIQDPETISNTVQGNYIGTDLTGTVALSNTRGVIIMSGAQNNLIGGKAAGARNLISGNTAVGIGLQNKGTSDNQVQGNYIGTDLTGMAPLGNLNGVSIARGAQNNFIGGETASTRNLVSGNTEVGIWLQDESTSKNEVQGNYIGTDLTGMASLGNTWGVVIMSGAQNNLIGGEAAGTRNLISGNTRVGLQIQNFGTSDNKVQGNYIGSDLAGTVSLSNTWGVVITSSAQNNFIGGETEGARNLISGNTKTGIQIQNEGTSNNKVQGNYIGTDRTGTAYLGNTWGILIRDEAHDNLVGGETVGARNIISGNTEVGILLRDEGTSRNQVQGNYIGTDLTGTASLSNTWGVVIGFSAQSNLIGGESVGARNLISGNTVGLQIQNDGTNGNQVQGNYIGTDAEGTTSLSNVKGVFIGDSAQNNLIGGAGLARNVISGNTEAGIKINGDETSQNQVLGNYIGTDATGGRSLGNTRGVIILNGAQNNLIGGKTAGARNLISSNIEVGIWLQDEGTSQNHVQGNYIGTDLTGTTSLGNTWGVAIGLAAQNNLIGGESAETRNLISGNTKTGLQIQNKGTSGNQVQGNYIGTDVTGSGSLGNGLNGVYLVDGASSNTIGISNTIAYNGEAGVLIKGEMTLGNTITRNIIKNNGVFPIDWVNIPMPISPPMLTTRSNKTISGSTCGHCTVEIFANPNSDPAGVMFWHEVVADSEGVFSARLDTWPAEMSYLSATVTGVDGTTSEFSSSIGIVVTPIPTNTPINTPTATNTPINTPIATNTPINTPIATNTPTGTSTVIKLYLPAVLR